MRNEFRPGAISTRQAGLLNELLELSEQWRRMTVAPPLYLKRIAGIPCITAGAVAGTVLAKITGHDASSPPVHTAVQQTAAASGAAADAAPAVTYTQVFFPLGGRALETGTLVALVAVADSANRYWAFPLQVGFPARLTTAWSGAAGYSWTLLVRTGLALAPASPEITFSGAITPDVDTTLTAGTDGWMEPDPTGAGMIFIPATSSSSDCKNCGWLAGMGATRCLLVTVNGVATTLYLTSTDGVEWTSADALTICGTDYTVVVAIGAGAPPELLLVVPGSGGLTTYGVLTCCGCAYAQWAFNLQAICPDEPDTGDPCTNILTVRVDSVDCAGGPSCDTAPAVALGEPMRNQSTGVGTYESGFLFWSISVVAGTTYRVRFRRHGPAGGGIAVISGIIYSPSCASSTTDEFAFDSGATLLDTDTDYCWDFTPTISGCLCISMGNDNVFNQNTATITTGSCP